MRTPAQLRHFDEFAKRAKETLCDWCGKRIGNNFVRTYVLDKNGWHRTGEVRWLCRECIQMETKR